MKTARQQQQERREKKLEDVRRQMANRSLTVRQMTPSERRAADVSRARANA